MEHLIIIGARAMGREACSYAQDCGFEVKCFLDSEAGMLDLFDGYPPISGPVEAYEIAVDDVFVCALGDPDMKRRYASIIAARGGRFVSVVHPTAYIGRNVAIGDGCIVCPGAVVTNETVLGNHVIVNVGATINHDNRIGDYATICPGCHLAGRVQVGESVFLGTGVTIIPDVQLGAGVFVAAGATVTKSFMSGRLMGVPARIK